MSKGNWEEYKDIIAVITFIVITFLSVLFYVKYELKKYRQDFKPEDKDRGQ